MSKETTEPLEEGVESFFIDKETFSKQVEILVLDSNGEISFIDAAISVAEFHQIDLEDINSYILPKVKSRIKMEALESRLIHQDKSKQTLDTFYSK